MSRPGTQRRGAPAGFVQPMAPALWPAPFDHREWLYEIKLDGFRALAIVEPSGVVR